MSATYYDLRDIYISKKYEGKMKGASKDEYY